MSGTGVTEFSSVKELNAALTATLNALFFGRDEYTTQCRLILKKRCKKIGPAYLRLLEECRGFSEAEYYKWATRGVLKSYAGCLDAFDELVQEYHPYKFNTYLVMQAWFEVFDCVLKSERKKDSRTLESIHQQLKRDMTRKYDSVSETSYDEVEKLMSDFMSNVKNRRRKSFKVKPIILDNDKVDFNHVLAESREFVVAELSKRDKGKDAGLIY